jgi:chromosome segregation ATPase
MYRSLSRTFVLTLAFAFACPLLGCSSDKGRERSSKAVGSLTATREELANSRKQTDEVLASLTALQDAQGDLTPAFNKYKEEVKQTEAQAKRTRERAADMRTRAEEYQRKWQDEMATVENPDLKAAAQQRSQKVRERYAAISEKTQTTRAAYEPFITDLKDVQKYLSNDLTPAAIAAAKPVFEKAKASGAELNAKMDALSGEMASVAHELSPGTPAKQ